MILFVVTLSLGITNEFGKAQMNFTLLNMQLDGIRQDIEEMGNTPSEVRVLGEKASLLASVDWNINILEKETKDVELTISVVPKEYIEGMEVVFYADCSDGTKLSVKGKETEAMKFVGKVEVPFSKLVNITVTMKKDDVTQIQQILSDTVQGRFVLDIDGDWTGSYGHHGRTLQTDGEVALDLKSIYEQNLRAMKKLELVIFVDEKEWKRFPMKIEKDGEDRYTISYYTELKENIPLEVDEDWKMIIEGEDRYGIHYRKVVMQTYFKENGEPVDRWEQQPETEVY